MTVYHRWFIVGDHIRYIIGGTFGICTVTTAVFPKNNFSKYFKVFQLRKCYLSKKYTRIRKVESYFLFAGNKMGGDGVDILSKLSQRSILHW